MCWGFKVQMKARYNSRSNFKTIPLNTKLSPDMSSFENSVDPDQLASEKPADLDPHCFYSACILESCKLIIKMEKSAVNRKYPAWQGLSS